MTNPVYTARITGNRGRFRVQHFFTEPRTSQAFPVEKITTVNPSRPIPSWSVFNMPIERTSKSGVGHNDEFYGRDGKFDYTAGLLIIAGVGGVETRRELRTEYGGY
jgi:hypothetical protein